MGRKLLINYKEVYCCFNKYDIFLAILILALAFGNVGGGLQVARACALVFFPSFLFIIFSKELEKIHFVILFFMFVMTYSLLSLIWCENLSNGWLQCLYNFIHFSLFLEIVGFGIKANSPVKIIVLSWVIAFLLTSVIGLWEIFTGNHLSYSKWNQEILYNIGNGQFLNRYYASVTFGNFNMYSTYICFSFPFIIYAISMKRKLAIFAVFLSLFIILCNASRGCMISAFIMLLVYLLMHKSLKTKVVTLTLVFLFLFVSANLFDGLTNVAFSRLFGDDAMSDESRMTIWMAVISSLIDTYGIGSGAGNLIDFLRNYTSQRVLAPHCMLFELLGEYGIFCFVFLAATILYSTKLVDWKNSYKKNLMLMVVLSFPFYSVVNSLYLTSPATYAFFASVYAISQKRKF